jgi:hypothetical protein
VDVQILLLVLAVLLLAVLLIWWRKRRPTVETIDATSAAVDVKPNAITLPEPPGPEQRDRRRRTGETQELRRKIEHGPFRPIDDRGEPTDVRRRGDS